MKCGYLPGTTTTTTTNLLASSKMIYFDRTKLTLLITIATEFNLEDLFEHASSNNCRPVVLSVLNRQILCRVVSTTVESFNLGINSYLGFDCHQLPTFQYLTRFELITL